MQEKPEYTEAYTFKEKLPMMGMILICGLLFTTVYHYYLYSVQKEYLDTMHCSETFVKSFRIGVIIFITALMSFPLYLIFHAKNIIKFKQIPYKKKKYLNRIKIIKGKKAIIKGWILIFLSIVLIITFIGIYVSFEYEILKNIDISKINKLDCPIAE